MLKWFNKRKKGNKGFTLVELIIVVAILAILVGLLAPQYTKYVEKSRKSADVSNLDNVVQGIKVAASDEDFLIQPAKYTITLATDGLTIVQSDAGTAPTGIQTGVNDYIGAIKEYTGFDFTGNKLGSIKLKSAKWGTTSGSISAVVEVQTNGAVKVTYDPVDLKDKA